MKRYFLHTTSTYVFEAENDEEAIKMVENNMDAIEDGIEGEELVDIVEYLPSGDDSPRLVKYYGGENANV